MGVIGALCFRLSVSRTGWMEGFAGRLLHAALFRLLDGVSPSLAVRVHAGSRIRNFTISPLMRDGTALCRQKPFLAKEGTSFLWRVTALDEEILYALLEVCPGSVLQIGKVTCRIEEVFQNGAEGTTLLTEEELLAQAFARSKEREITLQFLSPVAFRRGREDYPLPLPGLVFSSLAAKWEEAKMSLSLDEERVSRLADEMVPLDWAGETRRVYFAKSHGVRGFVGTYTFGLQGMDAEDRQLLWLLARFSFFSGVGRLTAQGLGQTRVLFPS